VKWAWLPLGLALLAQPTQPVVSMEDQDTAEWYVPPEPSAASIQWATADSFTGAIPFCVGYFEGDRYEDAGAGWQTDYPDAGRHFQQRLGELTTVRVGPQVVVRFDDPLLTRCAVVYASDVGIIRFTETEVAGLRAYLDKGGLLWVDDFWGTFALQQWLEEFGRVWKAPFLPILPGHELYSMLYAVREVPQIPNAGFWTQGQAAMTSERGPDSKDVHFWGAWDDHGRLVALMSHNTDVQDTWEEESVAPFFLHFAPTGYAIGINVVLYALSH
jgi:hypothetical protein